MKVTAKECRPLAEKHHMHHLARPMNCNVISGEYAGCVGTAFYDGSTHVIATINKFELNGRGGYKSFDHLGRTLLPRADVTLRD